jgi:hypothetical protein
LPTTNLGARLGNSIETYNKWRSPEVNAKILSVRRDGQQFVVLFTGSFCRTCGFYDYFEDLIYDLLDTSNIRARISKVKEGWKTENFQVTYDIE